MKPKQNGNCDQSETDKNTSKIGNKFIKNSNNSTDWQNTNKGIKSKLNYLFESKIHSDLQVKIGTVLIPCHRLVLIMNSPVFETMLSQRWISNHLKTTIPTMQDQSSESEMKSSLSFNNEDGNEAKEIKAEVDEIKLSDADPNVFLIILKFLYTEELPEDLSCETILEILRFACLYFIQDLIDKCIDLLNEMLKSGSNLSESAAVAEEADENYKNVPESHEIVLPIYELAIELSLIHLEQISVDFIKRNAASVVKTNAFLNISRSTLCKLLEMDDLDISEPILFQAVLKWTNAECSRQLLDPNVENQRHILKDALHLIRFPMFSPDTFATEVVSLGLLSLEERVEVLTYFSMTPEKREKLTHLFYFRTQPRCYQAEFTLKRFADIGTTDFDFSKNWRFLCFQVDHPINITSLGFYGSSSQNMDTNFDIRVSISKLQPGTTSREILYDSTQLIYAQAGTKIFHFKIANSILIAQDEEYSIGFIIQGSNTFMGDIIQDSITMCCGIQGNVTFKFGLAKIKNNRYQIPEIKFTL